MVHSQRKIRSKRGSRTCGYGGAQKHRGAGHRGGRGMAGSSKQKWSYVSKYKKNYFGKKGFKRHRKLRTELNTVNVGFVNENLDTWVSEGKASVEGKIYKLDLSSLGYDKLLGGGVLSQKVEINIGSFSQKAKEKVEASGGSITTSIDDVSYNEA
jgi:large subunit ribosomal protein L15